MVKLATRSERGTGLKFSIECVKTVRSFSPYTPIKYGPNPKRPGSKSFDRYAGYMKARTVGEALHLGAKVPDLCWELSRGDYKILPKSQTPKTLRNMTGKDIKKVEEKLASIVGPRGLAVSLDDKHAQRELEKEEKWMEGKLKLIAAYAKKLGVELESETVENLQEDGVYENSDTRNGRLVADAQAQTLLQRRKAGGKITEADVTEVLRLWGFAQNCNRLNVLPGGRKWVYSDTLGAIQRRTGGYGITPPTKRYPNVAKILNQWLLDNRPVGIATDFVCTSININANYGARTHRDGNNVGPSAIRAFGVFTGGELSYWDRDDKKTPPDQLEAKHARKLNIKNRTAIFDGNLAHCVEKFEGERISVVFFSCRNSNRVGEENISFLKKECGFQWPTEQSLAKLKEFAHTQFSKQK